MQTDVVGLPARSGMDAYAEGLLGRRMEHGSWGESRVLQKENREGGGTE